MRFPRDSAFSFFTTAIIEAANSGILVPKATNETEITASLTPIFFATTTAPFTSQSAPKYKASPPINNHVIILKYETWDRISISERLSSADCLDFLTSKKIKIKRAANKTPPSKDDN